MITLLPTNEPLHLQQLDIALRQRLDTLQTNYANTLASNAPVNLLPALAWGYDIDITTMSEAEARNILTKPFSYKSKVATMGAVKRLVHAFDNDATVEDLFTMRALRLDGTCTMDGIYRYLSDDITDWVQYKITLFNSLSPSQGEKLKHLLEDVAPARCELVGYTYMPSLAWDGVCKLDGTLQYGGFYGA